MANTIFNSWKTIQLGGTLSAAYTGGVINFLTMDIKVMLTTGWTPNGDSDEYYSDISAYEVSSANYTAGGASLASKTVTKDNTGDRGLFDAATVTWSSVSLTADHACIYYNASTGEKPLIAAYYFGSAQTASNGNFTLTWSTSPDALFGIG